MNPKYIQLIERSVKKRTYLNLGHSKKKYILQILKDHREHDNAAHKLEVKCIIQIEVIVR